MAKASFSSLFAQDNGSVLTGFSFTNEAMVAAVKKAQEAKQVRAAEQSASLLADLDKHNNNRLQALRSIRKQERAAKEQLDSFKEAAQHFLDTGNFGPLYKFMPADVNRVCQALGVDIPTVEEQKIPTK
jgi:hypothetical protein